MRIRPLRQRLEGMAISDTAIRQPVLVTMVMLLLVVVGLLAYRRMPVSLLPNIDDVYVVVQVEYPGASPQTVADQVARPIEDEIAAIAGVKELTSESAAERALLIIQFISGTNGDLALQNVREKITRIRSELPNRIEEPVFERFDLNQSPILQLAVTSTSGQDGRALRQQLRDVVVPRIQQVPGVGAVGIDGGLTRQIDVQLDLRRLQARGLLPSQISDALRQASSDLGLGGVRVGDEEINVRAPSAITTLADLARVGIDDTGMTVADVAQVVDGTKDVETYARYNGADTIQLSVRKQSGANTVAVAEAALVALDRALANTPDLRYAVVVNEAAEVRKNVRGALEEIFVAIGCAVVVVMFFFSGLRRTLLTLVLPALVLLGGLFVLPLFGIVVDLLLLSGVVLVVLVALTFLRDRNTAVTVLGLPVIMVGTFAAIAPFGIGINIISLLALSVSVGMVIDDAIVIRENIFRHIERGEPPTLAASRATAQVAAAVLAMTLTVIAVFVPAAFTTGTAGIIFKSFGITVAAAMAISLFEGFTLAPMLSAYWFKGMPGGTHRPPEVLAPNEPQLPPEAQEALGPLERSYERLLHWTLRHRFVMVCVAALVVALSVGAASGLKFAFLPADEGRGLNLAFGLAPGTPLGSTDAEARAVEAILMADPAVESVLATVGASAGGAERATFQLRLHEGITPLAAQAGLRRQLPAVPNLVFGLPSYEGGSGTDVGSRPLRVQVRGGGTPAELEPVAEQLLAAFRGVAGLSDLESSAKPGKRELRYRLRLDRARDYGLNNEALAGTLRVLLDGDEAAKYREGGKEYPIVVRLRPADRTSIAGLREVRLPIGDTLVPLAAIADIEIGSSPTTIRRVDRQTEILLGGNNLGRNINDVEADMQAQIDQLTLPPGVSVGFAGATEEQDASFTALLLAMAIGVLFVYMVLAAQFASFQQPLLIMLAMPLSFMGAFLALRLTGLELDIVAMIGMLMLLGLVVKNSILLVDFTNTLQDAGLGTDDALARAGAVRLRPILMTSATVLLGSLPSAIGLGEGTGLRRGLATVVIGGILTSTLLTLLLIPVAFSLLQSLNERVAGWWARRRTASTTPAALPAAVPTMPQQETRSHPDGHVPLATTQHAAQADATTIAVPAGHDDQDAE